MGEGSPKTPLSERGLQAERRKCKCQESPGSSVPAQDLLEELFAALPPELRPDYELVRKQAFHGGNHAFAELLLFATPPKVRAFSRFQLEFLLDTSRFFTLFAGPEGLAQKVICLHINPLSERGL